MIGILHSGSHNQAGQHNTGWSEIWVEHKVLRATPEAIRAQNWYILRSVRHIKLGRQAPPFFQDFCMKLQICSLLPLSAAAWNTVGCRFIQMPLRRLLSLHTQCILHLSVGFAIYISNDSITYRMYIQQITISGLHLLEGSLALPSGFG